MLRKRTTHSRLAEVPLFSGCSDRELGQIARYCTQIDLRAGAVLIEEGRTGHEFFIVERGTAVVSIDGVPVATVGAGGFFGELSLLDDGRRTATVVAETDLVVEVLGRREFAGLLLSAPNVGRKILQSVAARLRAADQQLTLLEPCAP